MKVSISRRFTDGVGRRVAALAIGVLGATAPMAHAATVDVNVKFESQYQTFNPNFTFGPGGGGNQAAVNPFFPSAPTGSAYYVGVGAASDAGTFWNSAPQFVSPAYTVTNATASDGATPTGVKVAVTGGGGFVDNNGDPQQNFANLYGSYTDGGGNISITGLADNAAYSLYLYGGGHNDGGVSTFSITNGVADHGDTSTTIGDERVLGTEGENWVLFTGTTSSAGTIAGTYTGVLSGLQIVEVVPEPASLSLLGFAGLGFLACRRRARSASCFPSA